jgi:hypothetical protein
VTSHNQRQSPGYKEKLPIAAVLISDIKIRNEHLFPSSLGDSSKHMICGTGTKSSELSEPVEIIFSEKMRYQYSIISTVSVLISDG